MFALLILSDSGIVNLETRLVGAGYKNILFSMLYRHGVPLGLAPTSPNEPPSWVPRGISPGVPTGPAMYATISKSRDRMT